MSLLSSASVRDLERAALARRQRAALALSCVAATVVLDACVVEPRWLARTEVDLPSERGAGPTTPLRIAVISDLHTAGLGLVERATVRAVEEAKPDLVVITGDVVDDGRLLAARPVLAGLVATKPRWGTWAVAGNWEHWRPPSVDLPTFYADLGITLLDDDARPLDATNPAGLWIAGVDWEGSGARALAKVPRGAPLLALVHAPATFDDLRALAKDGDHRLAVLAGHTHGGQVRLPLIGALWLPPGSGVYDEGVFGDAQAALYVSRGIGTSIAPLRFFCRPELPVLTLRLAGGAIRLRIAKSRTRRAAGCPCLAGNVERCDLSAMLTWVPRFLRLSAGVASLVAPFGCSVGFVDDLSDGTAGASGASAAGQAGVAGLAGAAGRSGGAGVSGATGGVAAGGRAGASGAAGMAGTAAGGAGGASGQSGAAGVGGDNQAGSSGSGAAGVAGSPAGGGGNAGTAAGKGGAASGNGGASAGTGGGAGVGGGAGTGGSPLCSEGVTTCSGDIRQGCAQGQLVVLEACGPGLCTATRCLQCAEGSPATCEGNAPVSCVNGERVTGDACKPNETCSAGQCLDACVPGSFRCTGAVLQRCNLGGGYEDVQTCARAPLCDAPQGRCAECEPSETRCQQEGRVFESCNAGAWSIASSCTRGCIAGSGCITQLGPLAAGTQKTCVVADARAVCWGSTAHGELGQVAPSSAPHLLPVDEVAAIAIGRAHVCIMRPLTSAQPSHVACAGANDRGQLGRGSTGGDPLLFAPVPGLPTSIRTIFSAADTTCALDTSGDAWCWGKLFETQSGTPLRINGIGLDVEIMAIGGDDHALFASSIGPGSEGRAFGRNDTRQLGISSPISGPSSFPGDFFDAGSGIRHVAAGGTFTPNGRGLGHSCAVDASDRLYCWGLNEDGQAGQLGGVNIDLDADGNVRVIEKPQLVTTQVADIALGPRHTCLRTTNDRVRCFGASPDGRAGSNSPMIDMPLPNGARAIAVGDTHSCALSDGLGGTEVSCWGANEAGELGDGQPGGSMPRAVVLSIPQ